MGSRKDSLELALGRLKIRDYSAFEMREYLERKGAGESEASAVVAELVAQGLIHDGRFTRELARSQAKRDKGPSFILAKLQGKGVAIDLQKTRALFSEIIPEGEESMVRQLIDRRYPKALLSKKELRRAYQGLVRRGFSQEVVRKCLLSRTKLEDDLE